MPMSTTQVTRIDNREGGQVEDNRQAKQPGRLVEDARIGHNVRAERGRVDVGRLRARHLGGCPDAPRKCRSPATPGCARRTLPTSSWKYPDQETATAALLMAYSRIKSQPIIQAANSPSVA